MSVVDEVKARLDIVDYIQRYVPLKKAGRYHKAPCPFHSERTPSFVVNQDMQSWRCFGACATGGDIFAFAMRFHGWSFSEALGELAKIAGVELAPQSPEQKARNEEVDKLRGLLKAIDEVYHQHLFDDNPQSAAALAYVRDKRGLSDDTLHTFGIGFAPPGWRNALDYLLELGYTEDDVIQAGIATRNDSGKVYDRFRNRLMIPIRDERGRTIGFGARALDPNDTPKYLNSPQSALFDKSRILFGLDVAGRAIRDTETAVIVEGYMDAIQAHQAGFTNVVAQMGTAMTEAQLKRIAPRWAKRIIIALDADAAGQSATMRGLEVARETLQADYTGRLSVDIRILSIPGAKDPDDLIRETPEQWAALVENASPVADYVIAVETGSLPPNASLQEREAVARRLMPILLASESDLYKKDNLQKLALKLHIAERDLLLWADEQQRIAAAKAPRRGKNDPPELPPLNIVDVEPPPEEDEDEASAPRKPALPVPSSTDAELEKYCLRMLLLRPELFYHVNRKFRELARDDSDLLRGPLADLSPDDFSRSEYRALMMSFRAAMEQDDLELLDFVRAHLDPRLHEALNMLLQDEVDNLRDRLGHRMLADLTASLKQNGRSLMPVDMIGEMLEKSLRLRIQRLQRERQEMAFLQMDLQSRQDEAAEAAYQMQVWLSIEAKRLIEAELHRQRAGLTRQY